MSGTLSMIRSSFKKARRAPYERVKIRRWELLEYLQGVPSLFVPEYTKKPVHDVLEHVCTRKNVTGFSETSSEVTYSFGPAPNPYPWSIHSQGDMVYIITTEIQWRLLFDLFPKYCPQEDLGSYIYLFLTITRLLCFLAFFIHHTLGFFLPFPSIVRSTFRVLPIPEPEDAINGGPLDPRHIQGPAALEAARRAGYNMPL